MSATLSGIIVLVAMSSFSYSLSRYLIGHFVFFHEFTLTKRKETKRDSFKNTGYHLLFEKYIGAFGNRISRHIIFI